ncbi:MAG TPA: DUF4349 domain-containing protein [Pyrinomonadaceae bacterium]|nr:DUF4349 domain-containing protein [Pyrinomonadaceae bacterium]
MKKVHLLAFLFLALTAACNSQSSNTSARKEEPSFGIYDTSSNPASNSATSSANSGGGGGGGGGNSEKPLTQNVTAVAERPSNIPEAQKISLQQSEESQNAPVTEDRKIIRNAELNLEADSPEAVEQKITSIAESKGGFVVESEQSSSDVRAKTKDVVTMTVRVPAIKFNEALDEIRSSASRVVVESIKGQDVTEEFIDIEARLKAKKALEQQFLEIMKRSNSVDDALNVQRELADVRGEIEQIEGRKRFLENQASLSTIKIRIQTPAAISASSTGFFYRLIESFSTGFDFALNFILGLVTFLIAILPFALFIGLPTYLGIRYVWKRQSRPRSVSEIAEEELKND